MPVFVELQILAAFHTSCSDTNEWFCLFSHHVPSNRIWHEDVRRYWASGECELAEPVCWFSPVHLKYSNACSCSIWVVPKWRDYATYVSRPIHRVGKKQTKKPKPCHVDTQSFLLLHFYFPVSFAVFSKRLCVTHCNCVTRTSDEFDYNFDSIAFHLHCPFFVNSLYSDCENNGRECDRSAKRDCYSSDKPTSNLLKSSDKWIRIWTAGRTSNSKRRPSNVNKARKFTFSWMGRILYCDLDFYSWVVTRSLIYC